ncbi:MAG TPA: hypothetical protein VJ728_00005 [Candidatus Binataceae bacterium]|nr:hypothetical protein [Candidatus Binataceae bacterium]
MKRILLAGLLAGLAMYVWSSIAHIALPLGEVGVKEIANEQPVLSALAANLTQPGFYIYPGMAGDKDMQRYAAKLKSNPSGILIYHPAGASGLTPAMLIIELLTEIAVSILAVWLLAQTRIATYRGRVVFVSAVGLTAAIMTNIQYWNFYGFPANYTINYMFIQLVGFIVAGLVAAKMIKTGETARSAAA